MEVRTVKANEVEKLLKLYEHLHENDLRANPQDYQHTWNLIQDSDSIHYLAIEKAGEFIASLNITIIPNLTRGARSIAVIENVVTHAHYRNRGVGRKIMEHAIAIARKANCYKIMLLSSAKRAASHQFYKSLGFSDDKKTGFVLDL